MKQLIALIVIGSLGLGLQAQNRLQYTINSNWNFYKGKANVSDANIPWEPVTIPHSWNVEDVLDDEPGYYRDTACYSKDLFIPASWKDKKVFLVFDAIGINADIYVNGDLVRKHTGAYTSFNVDISDYLHFSEDGNTKNKLFVQANNTFTDEVAPLSADFTFFGGIYRDVQLLALEEVHFRMDEYNSKGVFWNTPKVSEKSADIILNGAFNSSLPQGKEVFVKHILFSKDGENVLEHNKKHESNRGKTVPFSCKLKLKKPELWSPESPNLYRLVSRLIVDGKIVDQIENPMAFRWFEFDSENGFSLNGSPYQLIGASRHQDFSNMGNALYDAMHIRDIELLKEMGGNFLRIAHYPQDETIIETCDRLGVLCSIEIPLVNAITESEAFFKNSEFMLLEMMAQYYNHPSLIIWAYMNEIFLRLPYESGTEEYEHYLKSANQLFSGLDNIIRENDPYRYSMMVGHGSGKVYKAAGLIDIPQLFGWNIYTGWYDGKSTSIGSSLDKKHKLCGDIPILLTEYGADADARIHNFNAERFDKSIEYATDYHIEYLKAFYKRKYLNGMMVWNLADFSSETRTETTPHVNTKGLLTIDRKQKDGYRFYKANLGKKPYVGIGSKEWNFRTDIATSEGANFVEQSVQVFSNANEVVLLHNGTKLAKGKIMNGFATFKVPFKQGSNQLLAKTSIDDIEISDQA
ncbi:MAG: glycoside hydrolase family 2 TIM barrel-domain containing protein, partial [Bacteroidales bacterium]|nr:glycoside hydrolase family 2 TIM barrel-domain containing protein [Bacteroidales bacterium]